MILYHDNKGAIRTGPLRALSFDTGVESLFTGRVVQAFVSAQADVGAAAIASLGPWTMAEVGASAEYLYQLPGAVITANMVAGIPRFLHVLSGEDLHVVMPIAVEAVRPLETAPSEIYLRNDFFVDLPLLQQMDSNGVLQPWAGAAAELYFAASSAVGAAAIHPDVALSVGTGLTSLGAGRYVGGFNGNATWARLQPYIDTVTHLHLKVGTELHYSAQVIVRAARPSA